MNGFLAHEKIFSSPSETRSSHKACTISGPFPFIKVSRISRHRICWKTSICSVIYKSPAVCVSTFEGNRDFSAFDFIQRYSGIVSGISGLPLRLLIMHRRAWISKSGPRFAILPIGFYKPPLCDYLNKIWDVIREPKFSTPLVRDAKRRIVLWYQKGVLSRRSVSAPRFRGGVFIRTAADKIFMGTLVAALHVQNVNFCRVHAVILYGGV